MVNCTSKKNIYDHFNSLDTNETNYIYQNQLFNFGYVLCRKVFFTILFKDFLISKVTL